MAPCFNSLDDDRIDARRREFWPSDRPHTNGEDGIGNADLRAERGLQHISSSRDLFTRASYPCLTWSSCEGHLQGGRSACQEDRGHVPEQWFLPCTKQN